MQNDKKVLRILHNLNSGIAKIGNHILFMFKIMALSIVLTLLASFFITSKWHTVGLILFIINALIVIYSIYSLYILSVKLKEIEISNNNFMLEILKDTK